jgi:F420-dependent oxidoreductase-like protein
MGEPSSPSDLRIGLIADNPNFPAGWDQVVEKVKMADQLGYDSVWLGEAWGYDVFTSLADLARVTGRIKLGTGIVNVFSRSPGVIASSIATLDERSGGRMLLGLGSSGGYVIEHWHGVRFEKPLRRLREYAEIINIILRREKLIYHGELFQLERGFKLQFTPLRKHIPIYIAAITPKSIEQTGEIADGVLPVYWPKEQYPAMRRMLDAGAAKAGRAADSASIAPYITTEILLDESQRPAARDRARGPVAFYIGRMGMFYAEMLARYGYTAEVEAVKRGWEAGPKTAARGVSDALLDATAIVGTPQEMAAQLIAWQQLGVDEPIITMPSGTPEQAGQALDALMQAVRAAQQR